MLSVPNFGNLMNPWSNVLRLQADATQLAKIQLMQNLLRVINTTSPLPNMVESNFIGSQNLTPFEGLLNGTSTEFQNPVLTPQPTSDYQPISNPWAGFEGGFSSEVFNIDNNSLSNSYDIQTEKSLPVSVSASPECSSANQMESNIDPTYISTQSPTSSVFEAWREFLDDETFGSDWQDILD
ncbi:hypothetical protein L1049_022318 [Liquidambar formosana]|uniref:Uncharacterized protein n=1 Tax=Liquidambar formosana TaxID=63359 RepID=A0AAP0RDN9_LIQFO